jgi:hypothetical protein
MAKEKKSAKSKKSGVRVRDLKTSKDPRGGLLPAVRPQQPTGGGKAKFNEF